eukprot:scaffold13031_cov101-Isochrysis_galbana.AAC.2
MSGKRRGCPPADRAARWRGGWRRRRPPSGDRAKGSQKERASAPARAEARGRGFGGREGEGRAQWACVPGQGAAKGWAGLRRRPERVLGGVRLGGGASGASWRNLRTLLQL